MDDELSTPLGTMRILEMLLFYEGPKLLSCQDITGTVYIAHLLDEEESGERWLFVPVSRERLEEVRTGRLSLRDSVRYAESGYALDVFNPYDHAPGSVRLRRVEQLDELELPGERARLKQPGDRLPIPNNDCGTEATRIMRDVLRLSLDNGRHDQVVDADRYGEFVLRTQNLVRYLSDWREVSRGPLPREIAEPNTLQFTGSFAASVGIELQSKYPDFAAPGTRGSIEALMKLLDAGDSRELLSTVLRSIPKRAVPRYRFLLDVLDAGGLSVHAQWGSPGRREWSANLTKEQAHAVIDLLDEEGDDLTELLTIRGDLIGVVKGKTMTRARFEFLAEDGVIYRGSIAPELATEDFKIATHDAIATLEATTEINPATGEEHITYVLVGIERH